MPTSEEFREQLHEVFRVATQRGQKSVTVEARSLHRAVGGYPNRGNHRMPVCCEVMRSEVHQGDLVLSEPPKKRGASLTIRYSLPRPSRGGGR